MTQQQELDARAHMIHLLQKERDELREKLAEYAGMTTRKMALRRAREWLTEDHSDVALAAMGDILGIGDEDAFRAELICAEKAEREAKANGR